MDELSTIDENRLQIPGNCPALIIQSISRPGNLIPADHLQELSLLQKISSWLFPTLKEYPLPNEHSYCKKVYY